MDDKEKINQLINLLEEVKTQLDTECCQTLMDADSLSLKIEKKIKEIKNYWLKKSLTKSPLAESGNSLNFFILTLAFALSSL